MVIKGDSMNTCKNFFRIFVIFFGVAAVLWAANPIVPQEGGNTYV